MPRLFLGQEGQKTLDTPISKLVKTATDSIRLESKGAKAQKITIDIGTRADILVLAAAIAERHQVDQAGKRLFHDHHPTATRPQAAYPPATNNDERLDALTEQVALLASGVLGKPAKGTPAPRPSGPTYALAASKHAPKGKETPPQKGTSAMGRKHPSPRSARHHAANTVLLR